MRRCNGDSCSHRSRRRQLQLRGGGLAIARDPARTISSDIYCKNRIKGPVYSLAHVMSKFLAIGMTLEQVLACVTQHAADALRLSGKGDSRWAPMPT